MTTDKFYSRENIMRKVNSSTHVIVWVTVMAFILGPASFAATPASAAVTLDPVSVRAAAAAAGLESLATVTVPVPFLGAYLRPGRDSRAAAIQLGKALFWDMQVGSDGQACGTCHFHAGADSRAKNQLSPGLNAGDDEFGNPAAAWWLGFPQFGPNYKLVAGDFPLHQLADPEENNFNLRNVLRDTNDVVSSQGVFGATFAGIVLGQSKDLGFPINDEIFNVNGTNVRRVEPRNTPTMINAVFNHENFWDGRAHNKFNGVSPIGPLDKNAAIWVLENGLLVQKKVRITNSSLASQAVGPPVSNLEMSFFDRPFPEIGRKLFSLRPLGRQFVHPQDSVLGPLARTWLDDGKVMGQRGLNADYKNMIKKAFNEEYWGSDQMIDGYTQMEKNFSLFFGLAVQMYEATLVSDQTRFDRFMEGDDTALSNRELRGLLVFINRGARGNFPEVDAAIAAAGIPIGAGNCSSCHGGPELTDASVASVSEEPIEVEETAILVNGLLQLSPETAFLDNGFANIGVRPIAEDLGRGSGKAQGFPFPLSSPQQALLGLAFAPDDLPLDECSVGGVDPLLPPCPVDNRISKDGAFKIPGLRNVALTGPYFHNGGQATLGQVVEFYDRQGDFADINVAHLERNMVFIDLHDADEPALIAFLLSLTDARVRNEKAPFDHPQLVVSNGQKGNAKTLTCEDDGQACDSLLRIPAIGAKGRAAAGLPPLGTFLDLPHLD
jgi:cytochrome c peroxidase